MKGGMRAAAAIGIGYMLGRRKKFRTATLMAAATAAGSTAVGGVLLKRGMKMLGDADALGKISPQLGELAESVRGDLLGAGKAAAAAAVSNRVDALTDSIAGHAERLRNPAATVAEGTEQAAETGRKAGRAGRRAADGAGGVARRAAGRGRSRSRDEEDRPGDEEDYEPEDADYEADEASEPDDEADDYEYADEPDGRGDGDEGDEEAPARRGGSRRRPPVTRARR